ncbi:MAG: glycosyltransferase family 2 protein [Flavobacterium sp.]
MKTALLISTYNWPESLELVLKSVMAQSVLPGEILIADDGSAGATKKIVEQFQRMSFVPIKHVWQEDKGFRKSKILNKAIAQSVSDYIIQIDGDCIMHREFVSDHIKAAQKGVYLYGSRVNILPNYVQEVFEKKQIEFNYFSKEIKNKSRSLHIPFFSKSFKAHSGISKKFRGCNVSFWKKDFIAINGYNEDFEGWGREDSDLAIRLGNNEIKAKRLRYAGIVYHIYHKINSKHNFKLNDTIQKGTIKNKTTKIVNGIDQYLS